MTKVVLNSAFSNGSLRNAAGASENGMRVFNNPEFGSVRTVIINGEIWFVGNDVAKCLGYKYPANAIQDHVDDEDKMVIQLSDIQDVDISPLPAHMKGSKITIINESGLYSLIMGSELDSARRFKRWVTSEVLPSIRKTGGYALGYGDRPMDEMVRAKMAVLEGAARMLNMNDASKVALLRSNFPELNPILPDYVPSKGVLRSATDLLKANNVEMSAKAFNKIAINKGILVEKERKSTHGIKRFKNISDGWLDFGENQVCPNNPRETQPLWYESRFKELLEKMELI